MALATTADLRHHLGLPDTVGDERVSACLDGASEWLTRALGRAWGSAARTELRRGTGRSTLVLKHYPVTALTAVSIGETVLDVADPEAVFLDPAERGILVRPRAVWPDAGYPDITVEYTAGEAVPAGVKLACIELAAHLYQTTGGRTSVSVGGEGSVSFAALGPTGYAALPAVAAAIDLYADPLR